MDYAVSPPLRVTLLKQTAFAPDRAFSADQRCRTGHAHVPSSGGVFSDTHHQLCNLPYSAARLINGQCQRGCQSIGYPFWVCSGGWRGALARWRTKSRHYWFLSSAASLSEPSKRETLKTSAGVTPQATAAALSWWSTTALFFFPHVWRAKTRMKGGMSGRWLEKHNLKPRRPPPPPPPSTPLTPSLSSHSPLLPFWHRENIVHWVTPIESALWFIAQFQTARRLNCTRSAKIHPRKAQEMWKIKCHRGSSGKLSPLIEQNMLASFCADGWRPQAVLNLLSNVMYRRMCLLLKNSEKT